LVTRVKGDKIPAKYLYPSPPLPMKLEKSLPKYLAEFLGTFTLVLAVSLSLMNGLALGTPLVAGLTVGLFVYSLGAISGAHFNPAVTVGLWSVKKINWQDGLMYIIFQVIGGLLAMLLVQKLTGDVLAVGAADSWPIGIAEALGAFILVFGICSVVYGNADDDASGLIIGGSLLLGIMVASSFSNGVVNPAVALGIGSVSATYLIAPLVGGILAAQAYKWLARK
jgi:aquaporin Z